MAKSWPTSPEVQALMHGDGLIAANINTDWLDIVLAATIDQVCVLCPDVTSDDGYLPDALPAAVIIQARRWYLREDTPAGTGGGHTDFGPVFADRGLDRDVLAMIRPYRRPIIGGACV